MTKAKYILYVEDDSIDQLALKRILQKDERIGYSIVNSIKDTKSLLSQKAYDLVISDYYLHDGSVHEVLAITQGIPTIVISGTIKQEEKGVIKNLGAMYYLGKPLIPSTFLPLVQEILFGCPPVKGPQKDSQELRIDFDHIKNLSKMPPEWEVELTKTFLLDVPNILTELEGGLAQNKPEQIGEILQSLPPKLDLIGLGVYKSQTKHLARNFQLGENNLVIRAELRDLINQIVVAVKAASHLIPKM